MRTSEASFKPLEPLTPPSGEAKKMVEVAMDGGWVVVRLAGEIDISTAPAVAQIVEDVQASGQRNLRFDLAAVEFMDSQGLKLVVQAQRRAKELGGHIEISGASQMITTTFELSGLGDLLHGDGKGA